jgi:CRP/FNR family transcriptional regulator, cyclic AMP receptor protein
MIVRACEKGSSEMSDLMSRGWFRLDRSRPQMAKHLEDLLFFKYFEYPELLALASYVELYEVPKGSVVLEENSINQDLFIVIKGTLSVRKQSEDAGDVILSEIKPGRIFGEVSVIDQYRCSATVISNNKSVLAALPKASLRHLLNTNPKLANRVVVGVARVLAFKLRRTSGLLADLVDEG